jgi:signal peptide peptidase SppA
MKIIDILTSPWAIAPEKLNEIRSIYLAHLRGEKIDWKAIEARIPPGKMGDGEDIYPVVNGAAIIPVRGVLSKGSSFFSWLFGGSSMRAIGSSVQAALYDPNVQRVILSVDSPGGTVDGTEELADLIYKARGVKPIVAHCDGSMASAAYWIASAADRLYISGDTAQVGSIGIVATHIDQSEWDKKMGDSYTEITAGKYKRLASIHKPLSSEGAQYLQDQVDYIYRAFLDAVARNRGCSPEKALAMADGKNFIGKQAVEVGLVDGVSTMSELLSARDAGGASRANQATRLKLQKEEQEPMTLEELKQKHPDVYASAVSEGRTAGAAESAERAKEAGLAEGRAKGAEEERQRIAGIREQSMPGHEALIESLIADGKSTAADAAMKILATEKIKRADAMNNYQKDAPPPVGAPPAPETPPAPAAARDGFMEAVEARMAERKITRGQAVAELAKEKPELHEAWLKSIRKEG